jgi:hypothetical protein
VNPVCICLRRISVTVRQWHVECARCLELSMKCDATRQQWVGCISLSCNHAPIPLSTHGNRYMHRRNVRSDVVS